MPELRIIVLFAVLFAATARGQEPPGDRVYNAIIGEYTISVPESHVIGMPPPSYIAPGSADGASNLLVFFSGSWLASHIDWFQPVLNNTLQGVTVQVFIGHNEEMRENRNEKARAMWYGRHQYTDRVVTERKEPNTGLFIITYPSHESSILRLVPSLPDPSKPYPEDSSWDFLVCRHDKPLSIIKDAKPYTKCIVHEEVNEDIAFQMSLWSENLRIKDRITSHVAAEIAQWITMRPDHDD